MVRMQPAFLRAASKLDMIRRLLVNLKGLYVNVKDDERALSVVECLLLVQPASPGSVATRACLLLRLGRKEEATEQLRRYLDCAPGAADAKRIGSLVRRLEAGLAVAGGELGCVRGAVFGRVRGVEVPRHYGDPAAEYRATREGLAIRDRSHRARLLVRGRAPIAALQGVLTGRMPSAPGALRKGLVSAPIEYSAVLTPKGRMIADLRAMWGPESERGEPVSRRTGSGGRAAAGRT